MSAFEEHRARIDQYLQWAREAQTDDERRLFLTMAKILLSKLTHDDRVLPRLPKASTLAESAWMR